MLSTNQIPPSTYATEPELTDAEEATLNKAKDQPGPSDKTRLSTSEKSSISVSQSGISPSDLTWPSIPARLSAPPPSPEEISSLLDLVPPHRNQPAGTASPSSEPALPSSPVHDSDVANLDRTLSDLSSEYQGMGAGNFRSVMNASGSIRQEPADYQPQPGEAFLQEPEGQDLDLPKLRLQHAIDPKQTPNPDAEGAERNPGKKFGFPKSHFDHAFHNPGQEEDHSITLKGGKTINVPNNQTDKTSVGRLTDMMPSRLTQDGHLQRLSTQEDLAHQGSGSNDRVNTTQFFESAAALKYAQQKGYDPSTVERHSANIDFRARKGNSEGGEKVYFDPFDSPQYGQLSGQAKTAQQALERHETGKSTDNLSEKELKDLQQRVKVAEAAAEKHEKTLNQTTKFVNDAYKKHTDNSKAVGDPNVKEVTGVWNQTFTKDGQLQHEEKKTEAKGKMERVDLNLPHEFAREDNLARQQIAHRKANATTQGVADAGEAVPGDEEKAFNG